MADDNVVAFPHSGPFTPEMQRVIQKAHDLRVRVMGFGEKPRLVGVSMIIDSHEVRLLLYDTPDGKPNGEGWDWVLCSAAEKDE